jgi:hypothetical protein
VATAFPSPASGFLDSFDSGLGGLHPLRPEIRPELPYPGPADHRRPASRRRAWPQGQPHRGPSGHLQRPHCPRRSRSPRSRLSNGWPLLHLQG